MLKTKPVYLIAMLSVLLSSCQAIGNIFQAGIWVGIVVVIVVVIVLFAIFRKKS